MNTINEGILSTIGRTPLIELKKVCADFPLRLYAKLEMFNPGGSIKDRPASRIILDALENGDLKPGATVIESSSGNMAIGLAQLCRYYDLNLVVVVDPKINRHTLNILKAFGVRIEKVETPDEHGNYLSGRLQRVQDLLDMIPNSYWPNQYANKANPHAHHQTMAEIVESMDNPPDYLFASTSTCGTIMGCAEYVRSQNLHTKMVAVDALGSVIFGSSAAERLVPGHGAGRSSKLLNKDFIDHVVHINDKECVGGCHRLLNKEAILAGGSSGAVIAAVEKLRSQIPDGSSCALILPDNGERYLDTIYNDEWIKAHFEKSECSIAVKGRAQEVEVDAEESDDLQKIAIIGGGPKGMYGFERLAAQFKAHLVEHKVEIHVYNKTAHFGAGDIYQPNQPEYLLMNNPIGDVNMWIDEQPRPVVPEPLSLTEWLQKKKNRTVIEKEYASRALVGEYLEDGFNAIANHLPEGVRGSYFQGEVIDLEKENEDECYSIHVKTARGDVQKMPHQYDQVLLATGHPKNKLTEEEKEYQQFAQQNEGTGFVPFIYPVNSELQEVAAGSSVAVKGIGLTFVDAVLALTEGRGGTFEREGDSLKYVSSGKEPKVMYPFSRSGLPMIPRGPAPQNPTPLKFFTKKAFSRLKADLHGAKLDFKAHILPVLYQEMNVAFYDVQLKKYEYKVDLQDCETYAEIEHHIERFHQQHPDIQRFDPVLFLSHLDGPDFLHADSFHAKIKEYLEFFLAEAKKGELHSPWAAASAVWRKATPVFGDLYAFGGLEPESQAYVDSRFRRLLNRVTFGPPIESSEKILALIKAGMLNFRMAQNPSLQTSEDDHTFVLYSEDLDESVATNYLIDARIANVSIDENQSLLYKNLQQRGLITLFKNEAQNHVYQPGCAAISREGFTVDESGNPNPSIACTGTPTEGVTFDNDALSRNRNNFVSDWAAMVRKSHRVPSPIKS
ncbi:2,3-diaminopropionate biosynthesis protein SbnA [Gracilimonas mengyeensis]|uniref:N-(2-amino-2-carboxyethyl)-L-glutamate synthase n=1 Tax=Gracilimonas mengyeensis TaxID=1302730 RepID=A0A521CQK2_9BACT|nr:2,3-diaminopropionate biosynthesis protein SbnA [Gracilimonas mengyeensis]SMO61713.1 2,3-diaminopropionate biosynthesis protein SbnA [Gracilimonas mengyeensis]